MAVLFRVSMSCSLALFRESKHTDETCTNQCQRRVLVLNTHSKLINFSFILSYCLV